MDDIVGLVAIVMTFSIPLSAIVGSYYLKIKKLNTQADPKSLKRLEVALAENEELRQRVENLETIVTELDSQVRQLPSGPTN
ncbi:MAG: hypothetical protein ACFCUI_12485 [Bernardetiaceae bacterium]